MKNRILCLLVLLLGALFAQAEERPDYLSFTALWDYAEIGFDTRPEPYRVDLEIGREENGTITWSDYHYQDDEWGIYGESIWIAPGETVYFRGKKTLEDDEIDPIIGGIGYFWIEESSVDAGGVVTSLIDPTCQRKTLPPMCFYGLFSGCSNLRRAPSLPATQLSDGCYSEMFYDCRGLQEGPDLTHVTAVGEYSCASMFTGCESMTNATIPSVVELKAGTYYQMFFACYALKEAPDLSHITKVGEQSCHMMFCSTPIKKATIPADATLERECYFYMFGGCSNLEEAPDMSHITTLAEDSVCQMFTNCSNLKSVKVGFSEWGCDEWGKNFAYRWLDGVSSTGVFVCPAGLDTSVRSPSTVPEGWMVSYPPAVSLVSAAQRYPWNNVVDYTYALANCKASATYKLAVGLTVGGETKAVTNELTTVSDGNYTGMINAATLFPNTFDKAGKIKLQLIEAQ